MKKLLMVALLCCSAMAQTVESYQETADRIIAKANSSEQGYARLAKMCTLFPHRLSGSQALERCIDWVVADMKTDGFDSVTTEAVDVPHWERGLEKLTVSGGRVFEAASMKELAPHPGKEPKLWWREQ